MLDALAQLNASLTGRYAVEREIGRGGMATVYLARDLRHNRRVAVKVLDPELGAVLGVERFLSEIQVTANLQHPNLLPLFDSGQTEGLLFYVMPYVEGESLRAKLTREKQLPVDEALHIASAVASALDYAHRHGVIHRDLKPENILVHEGEPLVADFGIALAVSNAGGQRVTQTGISLGTPQYMSPEQATGDRTVDGRTDVYSLGAVTYEMLTGEPPHSGTTAQAIIAKVITDRPRGIRLSRDTVSPHIEEAVERALSKLPADRFHTAHEFADALRGRRIGAAVPPSVRTPGTIESYRSTRTWRHLGTRRDALWASVSIVLALLAALAASQFATPIQGAPSVSFSIEPPAFARRAGQEFGALAISRDGSAIAYVARTDSGPTVFVRRLMDFESHRVPGTDGAFELAFSPDGSWLAVLTWSGKLLRVPVGGGSPITMAEGTNFWAGVTWESDRALLITASFSRDAGISRIPVTGGTARPITKPGRGDSHAHPLVAPDGKTLIFIDWGPGHSEDDFLTIGSLETGEFTTTSLLAVQPIGVIDKWILYLNPGGAIMAVPFDARRRRLTGEPVRVIDDVTSTGSRQAALSETGTLVYRRGQPTHRLALVDSLGVARELSAEDYAFDVMAGGPTFSPDGQRIAATLAHRGGDTLASDVWTFDTASRTFSRLTRIGNVRGPQWTPDSKYLVFGGGTLFNIVSTPLWWQVADGSRPAEKLLEPVAGQQVSSPSITPDGRGILYCTGDDALFYLAFSDRKPVRVDAVPPGECIGRVSPDGRWWAYVAYDGAKPQVFVRSFGGTGGRVQVSADGGDAPLWSRDGRRLYYRRAADFLVGSSLFVADVEPLADGISVMSRNRLFELRGLSTYDLAPDGKHFLMLDPASTPNLVVTTNWISQFRARLTGTN